MADDTNQQPADQTSSKKFDSPWDEELPPEPAKKADVVGSLDAKPSALSSISGNKKPVPFNIPTDVGDEKVGKKIPAEKVISQPSKPVPTVAKPALAPNSNLNQIKPAQTTPTGVSKPVAVETTSINQPKSSGINELIQPPKAPVAPPLGAEDKTIPNLSQTPKPVSVLPKVENKVETNKAAKPTVPLEKVPIYPAPVANLKNESGALADIKPVNKNTELPKKEEPPPILPDISKPIDLASDDNELKPPSYIADARRNGKKEDKKKPAPPEIKKPVVNNEPPFYKKAKFLIPAILIFLFVLGTYLTEAGLISIGLEKVYGLTGVEALWGGLPRNPEKALGMSAQAMQKQLNFKIKGTVSMTVNKTIKSPVTSPLVSSINLPFAFRDSNNVKGISAITTQYDYYGSDTSSTSTSTGSSTSTSSSDTTSSSSTSTTNNSTPALGDQTSSAAYTPEESTIKQVDADITGQSGEQAIKADLIIKKLVGSSSSVSLLSTKNQLFVKSSQDIMFASNADPSKWLEFNISSVQNENPFKDFASIKLDQGFSIIGRRSGNEKIGTTRCFKYTIDNLEIGDSLDFLGIKKDSVQKIEGNVWIGVADHYIHKVDLKIIPSISSSISQMSITLELYDYGIENSIQIPALVDKVVANITANAAATSTSTSTTTTTPTVTSAVTMGERDQTRKNDLQNIKAALEKYKAANGKYPVANSMIHLDAKDNVVQKALVAEYISAIPNDPKVSDGWYYGYTSNGKKFTLSARLENTADPQVTKVGDIYLHWVYNN